MPAFTKAPLFLSLFLFLSRHLYLLKTKAKAKSIFKRDRKPAEDNKDNKNSKKVKPIPKRERKLIKINICFY